MSQGKRQRRSFYQAVLATSWSGFVAGNQSTLLVNGTDYFPAIETAIDRASHEDYLEGYIYQNDATGQRIADALKQPAGLRFLGWLCCGLLRLMMGISGYVPERAGPGSGGKGKERSELKNESSSEGQSNGQDGERESPESAPAALHLPVDVRSFSLALLTVLAVVFVLNWARAIFIPLMLGVMISYALAPFVNQLHKWRVPRAIGAAVLLLGILGGTGSLVYSLSDDATKLIETLPDAVHKFRVARLKERRPSGGTMESMQKTATQLEQVAKEAGAPAPDTPRGVTRVQIEKPKLNMQDYLWMGTKGAVAFAGQLIMVFFLAYFMLASGDTFRRKLVNISGPTLSRKKITLRVLDKIAEQIQRYLLVQIFTSILVGVATWLAFLWIDLEHAAVWGIAAGVFKTMPYLGPVVVCAGTALVAFVQFGTIGMVLLVSGTSLVITSLEGYLLTPWLTGRASRMSPVVVFASVLFWGWLWGLWGLLLGVPIMMIIKAICDHVEDLQPIGELLGD